LWLGTLLARKPKDPFSSGGGGGKGILPFDHKDTKEWKKYYL